ncbi:MAG: hypothetical protein JSV52_02235 [Candidatus Zixiibacteriota bacterium]|nr:MAG: hypothetical protein JSV52_02235 [candidate division Zixibacteria bacterium]
MSKITLVLLMVALLLLPGCEQKSPKRDQIPLLRAKLLALQNAVHERDRAAVDSLLSVKIVSKHQGSDSLLAFVYGPEGSFAFERFGNYNIVYTSDKARVECFIMDSTAATDRPIVLFLAHEHDLWLFTSFEQGKVDNDSLP